MRKRPESEFEALQEAAREATREWLPAKASMAIRAAGLDYVDAERASLDAIAADLGVSRETVRRARNELLRAIEPSAGAGSKAMYSSLSLHGPSQPSANSPATARALRRLLTMTGPLPWDEVLNAWARAGGKPPHSPLPTDVASMRKWASEAGGFLISAAEDLRSPVSIAAVLPEKLDQVSQFLLEALRGQAGGVDRRELLELAEAAGLKSTTIATTLSFHPAVVRLGRGRWALRGRPQGASREPVRLVEPQPTARARPTSFAWGADGSLMIEFSIPHSPSPVVAVPRAVSDFVEGREFHVDEGGKVTRVSVRNARLWGFGPLLSELGMRGGSRVKIALNFITSKATITPAEGKSKSR